jgi:serine protease Do
MTRHTRHVLCCFLAVALVACDQQPRGADGRVQPRDGGPLLDRVQQQLGEVPGSFDTTSAARLSAAFRAAAAQALPAVVQITTIAVAEMPAQLLPFHRDIGPQRMQGTGSGFIIDENGHILTNHHVVQNALHVNVVLLDGREYTAQVIGSDPSTDVAVIRIDRGSNERLPVIQLGESDNLRVGDWVLALGNPMGLTFTATAGIVSAVGRSINILPGDARLEAFIQTDAAINPGNSGGPLVDLGGRVIGINTAIESPTGYFAGAGFAIPIELARKVAGDLMQYGVVHRPRLGIQIDDVSAADAEVYRLPAITGAEITSVAPGTPAERAGLQLGDVIVTIEDQPIHTAAELQARTARFTPGDRVRVGFIRYGENLVATVELGEFEVAQAAARPRERPARDGNPLGFTVAALPASHATRLNLRGEDVPVVSRIDQLSQAFRGGLREGDVIRQFNGREVRSIRELERAAQNIRTGDVISIIALHALEEQPLPRIVNYRAH